MSNSVTDEVRILTPNAMLGYGYISDHFWYGVKTYKPHAIIVDSGSTDGGPYKLGLGKMTCSRESYERDMGNMLDACFHHGCKVMIGSAGGSGSDRHVDGLVDIIRDISAKRGYSFKIATIKSGIDKSLVQQKLKDGKIRPCGPVENLVIDEIDNACDIVGQMGAEPFLKVLREHDPDIIVAGRSYDPAPFAAFAMHHGMGTDQPGIVGRSWSVEGRSMMAIVRKDHFDLVPLNLAERCTPLSVAAHTLYEKTRPDILPGPGGELHLHNAKYIQQDDDRTTRISGAIFVPKPYEIKLEGASIMGYRTIFIGGIRDPILLSRIDDFLAAVHKYTCGLFPALAKGDPECQLLWHVYGKNAVMGPLEPVKETKSHELGILGEVVAPNQELASAIANNARVSCLHMPYKGQLATTGNFASPLTPLEQPCGPVCRFNIYHLMAIDDAEEFPVSCFQIEGNAKKDNTFRITDNKEISGASNGAKAIDVSVNGHDKKKAIRGSWNPSQSNKLINFAKVVRSKNSGPFEITFDVMFDTREPYEYVKASGILNRKLIAELYSLNPEDILYDGFFDAALAYKCSIIRPWEQGTIGERDTLGTAQHAPLLDVVIPPTMKPNGVKASGFHGHASTTSEDSPFSHNFTPADSVEAIWNLVGLPETALKSMNLASAKEPVLPSSFKIGHLAQASVALSTLAAALVQADRLEVQQLRGISVDMYHAAIEFKSERFTLLNGNPPPSPWGPIAGLYAVADGHVRVHDSFTNHRYGVAKLLDCEVDRQAITEKIKTWKKVDFEDAACKAGLCCFALRSEEEWDVHEQSSAISEHPVEIVKHKLDSSRHPSTSFSLVPCQMVNRRPLAGLRVLELSRVIAAPLAGRTLAAHGADVLWITSPNLPDLPGLDRDFARGKRTARLDLNLQEDKDRLIELIKGADVFLQSYRPGALAAKGFGPEDVRQINPSIIYATMSAWGDKGPWAQRRGFDSLVQTVSGMNTSEAILAGEDSPARVTPVQALDHAGGYLLAFGIMAAVHRRIVEGGSYDVAVSLSGAWKWLKALGRLEDGFDCFDPTTAEDVAGYLDTRKTGLGELAFIKHSGIIERSPAYWNMMPKPLGSDAPEWL